MSNKPHECTITVFVWGGNFTVKMGTKLWTKLRNVQLPNFTAHSQMLNVLISAKYAKGLINLFWQICLKYIKRMCLVLYYVHLHFKIFIKTSDA